MIRPQALPYTELEETNTDDETSENCHQATEPRSKAKKVSKIYRCLRDSRPYSRSNLYRRQVRYTEPPRQLLVLDAAALEEESRFMRFPGALNIDNSEVHIGNDVTTVNNTVYEPVAGGNILSTL